LVAPQYWLFEVGSMHVPLQLICVPGHDTAHTLAPQICPLPHIVPGMPIPAAPQPLVAPQY
jgi:hypothetical protein